MSDTPPGSTCRGPLHCQPSRGEPALVSAAHPIEAGASSPASPAPARPPSSSGSRVGSGPQAALQATTGVPIHPGQSTNSYDAGHKANKRCLCSRGCALCFWGFKSLCLSCDPPIHPRTSCPPAGDPEAVRLEAPASRRQRAPPPPPWTACLSSASAGRPGQWTPPRSACLASSWTSVSSWGQSWGGRCWPR